MTSDETRSLLDKEKIKSQSLCLRKASPHSLNRFGERSTNQQFSPRKAKIFKESVSGTEMLRGEIERGKRRGGGRLFDI